MIKVILIWDHRSFKSLHEIWFLLHSWRTKDYKLRCRYFFSQLYRRKKKKKKDIIWNLTCNLEFALPLSMLFSTKCMELKDIEGKKKKKSDRAKDQTYHGVAFLKPQPFCFAMKTNQKIKTKESHIPDLPGGCNISITQPPLI